MWEYPSTRQGVPLPSGRGYTASSKEDFLVMNGVVSLTISWYWREYWSHISLNRWDLLTLSEISTDRWKVCGLHLRVWNFRHPIFIQSRNLQWCSWGCKYLHFNKRLKIVLWVLLHTRGQHRMLHEKSIEYSLWCGTTLKRIHFRIYLSCHFRVIRKSDEADN